MLVSDPSVPEWERRPIRGLTRQRDLYTTFEGDREGDAFEIYLTREIEEPGQEAIERLIAKRKMKPADWRRIAMFVAAQHLRTPLFFVEIGPVLSTISVAAAMLQRGFFLNPAAFPAVARNHGGVRFTVTRYNDIPQIEAMLTNLNEVRLAHEGPDAVVDLSVFED